MLSTSLRRAAWAPLSGISRSTQNIPTTAIATRYVHQRRYSSSSSKPPVPPSDGSRRMDTSTPAKGVNSSSEKSKATRRRGKDSSGRNGSSRASQQHAVFSKLPSVPSTQHRQPHDVHVASFFSIHRPISVTTTVPPISTPEAFDAIFSKKFLKNEPEDVIFTLSSTVQSMENTTHNVSESEDQFGPLHRGFASDGEGELRMLDGPEAQMTVEEYTRRLRPFHPPPPPVPMDMSAEAMESAEAENQETTYSTVLTIREQRHADGRKTYEAHTGPFVRNDMEEPAQQDGVTIDAPTGSTSGMTYIERVQHNRTIHAISTKRRRKTKMKKHKFKKLMRRTRTLRRKLDKA
ncbi:hypothetical protein N7462_009508 [Penicillium macrosclerotiorum]|uniref:uncharacterized protein n=1 Tax=Penicillium macrosclerotiorum TaxID=303699 RepID=UPI00254704BD|nr:uncharacterized protein N7462_009508 [Penicillium macrosclerotiorum]KAJ5674069.1 hypothetical protein N7462_009508 [Penicillium macrosclerotiorum]